MKRVFWAAFFLSITLAVVAHLRSSHEAALASDALLCLCSVLWPLSGTWPFGSGNGHP